MAVEVKHRPVTGRPISKADYDEPLIFTGTPGKTIVFDVAGNAAEAEPGSGGGGSGEQGPPGNDGEDGADGVGVPVGGAEGYILAKASAADYDTEWIVAPTGGVGSVAWSDVTDKPATFTPSTHTHAIADVTGLQDALDGKQASGTYATTTDLTTGLASKADITYVDTSIANLINSAPGALNTLDELAAALGDDANYAATVTSALATKLDDSQAGTFGLTLLGSVNLAAAKTSLAYTKSDVGLSNVDNTTDLAKPISTLTQAALDLKQPLDTQLTDLAALVYTGNAGDVLKVNAGANGWELTPDLTAAGDVAGVRYDAAGAALGATIADYFTSSISLEANSTYEIEAEAYFLKTTAGTVTWTWAFSSAPIFAQSFWQAGPITGFTTSIVNGTPLFGHAVQEASTTLAHAASGSLTTAVRHAFMFSLRVRTNAATTIQLRATESAGTITPQPGSYMKARKIV